MILLWYFSCVSYAYREINNGERLYLSYNIILYAYKSKTIISNFHALEKFPQSERPEMAEYRGKITKNLLFMAPHVLLCDSLCGCPRLKKIIFIIISEYSYIVFVTVLERLDLVMVLINTYVT